jgi:hypothetical protein
MTFLAKMEYSGLTTSEINSHLSTYQKFRGTFAADQIPVLRPNEACVANTDTSDKRGQHWVLFFSPKHHSVEFFDSFGNHPCNTLLFPKTFASHIHTFHNLAFNASTFQGYDSNVCGHYCIYVILERWKGKSLNQIVTHLSNIQNTDVFVAERTKVKSCKTAGIDQCCLPARSWL